MQRSDKAQPDSTPAKAERKPWSTPRCIHIRVGEAENENGFSPDGGVLGS